MPLFNSTPDELDFETNETNGTVSFRTMKEYFDLTTKPFFLQKSSIWYIMAQFFSDFIPHKTLFTALRNREACTPAVRQQALSLIQLFLNTKSVASIHSFDHLKCSHCSLTLLVKLW